MASQPAGDIAFFDSAADWRTWLEANHGSASQAWLGFFRAAAAKGRLTVRDAVDQALCFGWIDGLVRPLDDVRYTVRFTPRRRGSRWSAVNVGRVRSLRELGLMRPDGEAAFQRRRPEDAEGYTYADRPDALPEPWATALRSNEAAHAFWSEQPPSYRRAVVEWVLGARRDETRRRRVATLIEDSASGHRVGWATYPRGDSGDRP